jgi:hypothetical protein
MSDFSGDQLKPCDQCGRSLTPLLTPHVKRQCEECGKTVYVAEPGEGGRGIVIKEGDQFVIPAGFIRMSLDPRKSTGKFFRPGINWFVRSLYFEGMPNTAEGLDSLLQQYEGQADKVLQDSSLLKDFDLENAEHGERVFELLKEKDHTPEWWAFVLGAHVHLVRDYIEAGDARKAAHAMGVLANARAMLIFLLDLEETVWRGYSLGNMRRVLEIWESSQSNADEEFWQTTLTQNSVVLSQVFSFPIIILQDKAYVGGMGVDQRGANIVDFLVANDLTGNTALVEIKTPVAKLLGRKYRGTYNPSRELVGAVAQISNYKHSLVTNAAQPAINLTAFNPPCLVIVGTSDQISDAAQRKAFELYRQGLRDVQIVTYDELFHKIANLVALLEGGAATS